MKNRTRPDDLWQEKGKITMYIRRTEIRSSKCGRRKLHKSISFKKLDFVETSRRESQFHYKLLHHLLATPNKKNRAFDSEIEIKGQKIVR